MPEQNPLLGPEWETALAEMDPSDLWEGEDLRDWVHKHENWKTAAAAIRALHATIEARDELVADLQHSFAALTNPPATSAARDARLRAEGAAEYAATLPKRIWDEFDEGTQKKHYCSFFQEEEKRLREEAGR